MKAYNGYISSIYNGSAVDGAGLRCVVFFSGCNLRCPFCHNIETLVLRGEKYSVKRLTERLLRYKNYLSGGGVTLSGGEPFLQADFSIALMKELKKNGLSAVIETNGHMINREMISLAEYIVCDVKNQETDDLSVYYDFLTECTRLGAKVELTNVLVPKKNDTAEKLTNLRKLAEDFNINLKFLPFRKLCVEKYKKLNIEFPYNEFEEA